MRRYLILLVTVLATLAMLGVAVDSVRAQEPTVTKSWYQYYSYRYLLTADHGTFTAGPRDGATNPQTTGGCVNVFRKVAGINRFQNTVCTSAGTVRYTTPLVVSCEKVFTIVQDGVVVYSDVVGPVCPPPPPPPVAIAHDDVAGTVTFTNPATVEQLASATMGVDSADEVLWSADPFTYHVDTRFASSGPNMYVYFLASIHVDLAAGQTITVIDATPGDDPVVGQLEPGTVYCALYATKGGHGCLVYATVPYPPEGVS